MQTTLRILILAGCMLLSSLVSGADSTEPKLRNFQSIIDSGQLRVGISIFPPWVMRAKDGQLVGSEVDMARRLAADMGISPEFGLYEWQQLIPALNKGDIDIIVSGMAIRPDRALKVNFSRPYGDSGVGLAANTKMTSEFTSMDDLKQPGINIGVIGGTVSADVAKRMFARTTVKVFSTEEEASKAVLEGKVHALIASNPMPKFLALKHPQKVDVPLEKPLLSFREGLAINKGDSDFLNFLDAWVVSRTADAWIPSSRRYWLESLEWQEQVQ